jgi:hypothetical protein
MLPVMFLLENMMKSRTLLAFAGIIAIIGPWLYALFAIRLNSNAGTDGRVMELATDISLVSFPLGLV